MAQTDRQSKPVNRKREGTILIGDLNRPPNNDRPSFGTKLLNEWIKEGYVKFLNNRSTPTRFDPVTGKGSTLDLGIISKNLIRAVLNFEVYSNQTWTPLPMQKKGYNMVIRKPSDHCAIHIKITIPCISTNNKKKPAINFRNPEGWKNYKIVSVKYASKMKELVENTEDIMI